MLLYTSKTVLRKQTLHLTRFIVILAIAGFWKWTLSTSKICMCMKTSCSGLHNGSFCNNSWILCPICYWNYGAVMCWFGDSWSVNCCGLVKTLAVSFPYVSLMCWHSKERISKTSLIKLLEYYITLWYPLVKEFPWMTGMGKKISSLCAFNKHQTLPLCKRNQHFYAVSV